jgi:hypothetical protein
MLTENRWAGEPMDSWLLETLTALAPTASKTLISVYDKIKNMKGNEAQRVLILLLLAQIVEQNNTTHKKLDSANESLAILLKRTEQ